jgi:hypothetical protein
MYASITAGSFAISAGVPRPIVRPWSRVAQGRAASWLDDHTLLVEA